MGDTTMSVITVTMDIMGMGGVGMGNGTQGTAPGGIAANSQKLQNKLIPVDIIQVRQIKNRSVLAYLL